MKNLKVRIISIVISILVIAIFLSVARSFVRTTVLSDNRVAYEQPIPSIAHGYTLSQQFMPQYDKIKSIAVYINALDRDVTQGMLRVNILDAGLSSVYENNIPLPELPKYGMTEIVKDVQLQSGSAYYLTIEAVEVVDDGPVLSFYPTVIAASTEEDGYILSYAGLPLTDSVLRVSFRYSVPLAATDYIVYCLFLFFAVCFLTERKTNFVNNA